jgi:RHS repeat-associated protein
MNTQFLCRTLIGFAFLCALTTTRANPIAPGTIGGTFDVGAQGSAAYTIPIKAPPGTAGMLPKLALSYNSQAGPGVMGPGWSISGYSIITRGPKNLERDGVVSGAIFDKTDALYLDGARLIPVSKAPDHSFTEYRPEIDDYSRIRGYGDGAKGHEYFQVWTKAGLTLTFGGTRESSPPRQDGTPFLWMCRRIEDTLGNYILFSYELHPGGDYNLKQVAYTGNEKARVEPYAFIDFEYEHLREVETTDGKGLPITTACIAGEKIFRSFRLKSVSSRLADSLLCRYELSYNPVDSNGPEKPTDSFCGFRLDHITETAADGRRYNPTRFTYTDSLDLNRPAWETVPALVPESIPSVRDPSAARVGVHYARLNDDETEDLIYSASIGGQLQQATYLSLNGRWEKTESFKLPVPLAAEGRSAGGILIRDINNDSRADVLIHQAGAKPQALINSRQNWEAKEAFAPPTPLGSVGESYRHYQFLDLDGDKLLDLVWNSATHGRGAKRQAADGWKDFPAAFQPPAALDAQGAFSLVIDANQDGKDDIVYCVHGQRPQVWLTTAQGFVPQNANSVFALDFICPSHEDGIRVGDVAGDQAPELLAAYRLDGTDIRKAYSADAAGWKEVAAFSPPLDFLTPDGQSTGVKLVDVTQDTKLDLVVHTRTYGGGAVLRHAFSFAPAAGMWADQPGLYPPAPMALIGEDRTFAELPVFLPAAQRGGKTILIYQTPVVGKDQVYVPEKAAYYNRDGSWVDAADFTPPQVIAQQDKADLGVRFVDFNADGLADLLVHYKPKEGDTIVRALENTAKGWKDAGAKWHFPIEIAKEDGEVAQITFIDVNGDARVDALVYHLAEDGTLKTRHAFINTPDHPDKCWQDQEKWHPKTALTQEKRGDLGVRLLDLNGDGLTDMISSFQKLNGSINTKAWLNTLNGWQENAAYATLAAGVAFAHEFRPVNPDKAFEDVHPQDWQEWQKHIMHRDTGVLLTDINGDRLPDLCFSHQFIEGIAKTAADYPNPNAPKPQPGGPPPAPPKPEDTPPNPGMYRLMLKHHDPVAGAFINTGNGWRPAREYTPPRQLDTPWGAKSHYTELQDLNLDGLTDLVYIQYLKNDGNQSATFLNHGKGWEPNAAPEWRLPDALFQKDAVVTDGKGDHGIRLMDINGDGAVDILQSYRVDNSNTPAQAWLNNGMTWRERSAYVPRVEGGAILPMADKTGGDTGVRPIDVNGDLIPDLIAWKKYADGTELRAAYVNQSKRRDILLTITNGMGFKIQFDHRTTTFWQGEATNSTPDSPATGEHPAQDRRLGQFYTPAAPGTYPILPAPPPVHAVETVRLWEPDANGNLVRLRQSLRYRYGEFRVNSFSGMPLGFGWRAVVNEQNGMSEFTRFNQTSSPFHVGTTRESRTAYNKNFLAVSAEEPCPGTPQSRLTNDWGDPVVIECLPNPAGKPYLRAQIALKSAKIELFDLDGSRLGHQTDSFAYDELGNATKVRTVLYNADGTLEGTGSETISRFDNNTEKWFLGRLSRATATLWNGQDKQVRTSTFGYDPKSGLLNRETSFDGHPKAVAITYEHDVFGNKVATRTEAKGLQPRTATVRFDRLGRFPVESANALGHKSTAEYEPVFGNVLAASDPNGVAARFEYDSHGAVSRQISPTGVVAKSSYRFLQQPIIVGEKTPSRAVFETVARVGTLPESRTLLDAQGRTLRTISVGEGGRRIFQDTEYDDLKRPYRASSPYFEGTKPTAIHWATTEYEDGTDRLLAVNFPDGGTVRYAYKGLTATVTDKLGRKTFTEYNLRKLPVRITDPIKGVLRYAYDVGDRLSRITNADNTVTRHIYDELGQRVETFDPDLGHWKYDYNAYNELVWQKDAKGQVTKLQYDTLGRPHFKEEADRWTTWEYDTAKHGLGKLGVIKGSDGYSATYTFDGFGRITQTTVTALGETFSTSSSFDEYNRTVGLTYPTGFEIEHTFDALGFMRRISGGPHQTTYWQGIRYDEFGQVTEEKFGNGIQTTHSYNRKSGNLDAIAAKDSQGHAVQDVRYTYDLAGNVKSRRDGVQQLDERFTYDSLDRLTSASVNGHIFQSLRYGITGTILSKSDVGTYTYGDGGKNSPAHAVTTITKSGGRRDTYKYDANGNLVSSPTLKNAIYTASNLTAALYNEKGAWSEFKYSPTGQKYWQEMRDGLARVRTLYLGLYERIQEEMVPLWMPTNERLRHRHYIAAPSGTCAIVEDITEFYPLRHSPRLHTLAPVGGDKSERTTRKVASTVYLHSDALGSISAISDTSGKILERLRFDPWGKRLPPGDKVEKEKEHYYTYKNGFTGHDHLDNIGFVHMGGRVFDPAVALFTRADPINQCLEATNCYNRYLYCIGNPLKYTDPTGLIFGKIGKWFGNQVKKVGSWLDKNVWQPVGKFLEKHWKTIVVITVAVVVSVVTFGAATPAMSGMAAGILAGAASGAVAAGTATALNGGNLSQVLEAMFIGGVKGALSGAFFGAAGAIGQGWGIVGQAAAYGVAGGFNSMMNGESFGSGFLTGSFTRFMSPISNSIQGFTGAGATRTVLAALVGGTASVIGGGKFANGAVSGALSRLIMDNQKQLGIDEMSKGLSRFVGRVMSLPFTLGAAVYGLGGTVWGGLVGQGWHWPTIEGNALEFEHNAFINNGSAVAIGNTILYSGSRDDPWCGYPPEGTCHPVSMHEQPHTYQWETLTPFGMAPWLWNPAPMEEAADSFMRGQGGPIPR